MSINLGMNQAIELFRSAVKSGAGLLFLVEKLDDPDEQERRYNICKANGGQGGCYNADSDQCKECTCFMSVKTGMLKHRNAFANLRTEVTHCPLAKWGGVDELEIVNHYRKLDGKQPLNLT